MRKTKKEKIKVRKIIKNILSRFFTLLVLGFVFILLYSVYQGFRKSTWDGKNNINFVIQGERTFIYSYHPGDEILNIISLPNNLFIETAKGYGEYELKNIYQLGEGEEIGGGDLLVMSLQNFFTVPIDGYIVKIPDSKFEIQNVSLEKARLSSLYFCLLTRDCKTDLGLWSLIRVFNNLGKLKFNQIDLTKIEETILFKKEKIADGSEVLRLESLQIDDFSQMFFTDKKFLNEGLKINVLNATYHPGLAKNASCLLRNIGGDIINNRDADDVFDNSVLYYADQKYEKSYSLNKIRQIFRIKKVLFDPQIKGDIKVILGKDFLNKFY